MLFDLSFHAPNFWTGHMTSPLGFENMHIHIQQYQSGSDLLNSSNLTNLKNFLGVAISALKYPV